MTIYITDGHPVDGAPYLKEILTAFGLCCVERGPLRDVLSVANPDTDLLILPAGSDADGLDAFLQAGGSAIAIQPPEPVAKLAGLSPSDERDRRSRLRLVAPICPGARGEPLWTLGQSIQYDGVSPEAVLAYLFEPVNLESECPGIALFQVGDGSLTIFAYDPAFCIMRLRQGSPERANFVPAGRPIPRSIHLHEPEPPQDSAWRPTADLHAMALCEVVKDLLARHAPVPILWHLPGGSPALLIFSGDEDGSTQQANQQEMADLEAHDGAMSLYVIQDGTSITSDLIQEYTQRGHTVSVHPNLVPTCALTQAEQLAKAETDVLQFKDKFGQPVHTVRNHCTMWPGYLDVPLLWERLGIGMDANCFASRYMQSPDWGPYVNVDAAMPLLFVREDGSLINVYQQPTHINDDVQCHPTEDYSQKYTAEQFDWVTRCILEDAMRLYHAPLCANFHPCNHVSFALQHGLALLRRARELNVPIWSLDRWHDFWRARASWRMTSHKWDGTTLSFILGGSACDGLWVTLPLTAGDSALSALSINGVESAFEQVERFQKPVAQAGLLVGADEVRVVAQYTG